MSRSQPAQLKRISASAAQVALRDRFVSINPEVFIDAKGYTARPEDNLIPGLDLEDFRVDFDQGSGNELAGKFRAVHSSSALAANVFGPFKRRPGDLSLCGKEGFETVDFERKCPVGLMQARTPPNLDLVAEAAKYVVAVESKCLEHFGRKTPKFADAYRDEITDERRNGPWFAEMLRLRDRPDAYQHLDAAQLIKHAFGLANTFKGIEVTLLYLFWEPANSNQWSLLNKHRTEVESFAARVRGGFPRFTWMTYPDLWADMRGPGQPGWLASHLDHLESRYLIDI